MPAESVKVVVRVRPMNKREKSQNCSLCVDVDEKLNQITLKKASDNDQKSFTFDYVFGLDAFQLNIYENTAFPLVESVVEGYNGTICAYGQTGCGKTFTMIGDPASDQQKGIVPRTFEHIINMINTADQANKKFLVRCSYLEIYNEDIHDLLGKGESFLNIKDTKVKMEIKESPDRGVFIKDLSIIAVRSVGEMEKYMTLGSNSKAVGATAMNEGSSRSHCIFTVYIECSVTDVKGNAKITAGKLNLVDLAGSERQDKTKATGDRLKEATKINLSLSALGNVISALVDGKSLHIPYRDSKLTRLLQDSLGGNTKTIIIAAVSPADESFDETSSTLRYAARAKLIKNQPKVNEDPKDAQLKEYADEIKKLKEQLAKQNGESTTQIIQPLQLVYAQKPPQQQQQLQPLNNDSKVKVEEMEKKMQKQKDKYESDMKAQEEIMFRERDEREKLQKLIQEKEQVLMSGGQANDEEKKKYKQIQGKIKQHKKDHEKLVEERNKQDGEMLKMEQSYNSLNDEVEQLRKLVTYLRKKYQESLSEIKDLEKENETNKSDLLINVRDQDKEIKLLTGIMKMLLTKDEIEVLRGASEWNDDQKDYKIPLFVLKQKKLNFPKLPGAQAIDYIEQEKEARELKFNEDYQPDSEMRETFRQQRHNNYSSPQVPKKGNEKQPLRNDSVPMYVNSALSGSNCSLPTEKIYSSQPVQQEKRQTKVVLQPIQDGGYYQIPRSPQSYNYTDSSQNNLTLEQNQSNIPGQKYNKANVQLQPMDRPPMIPREHLGDLQQPQTDHKRPGKVGRLDKLN